MIVVVLTAAFALPPAVLQSSPGGADVRGRSGVNTSALCADLREIHRRDERFNRLLASNPSWRRIQRTANVELKNVVALWRSAARNGPTRMTSDFVVLAEFTKRSIGVIAASTSAEDFVRRVRADPDAEAAGAAATRANKYGLRTCGVSPKA